MRGKGAAIEVLTRKLADIRMHPELNVQLQHLVRQILKAQLFVAAFHKGSFKAMLLRFEGKDGGWKLQRVADDDEFQRAEFDDRNEKLEVGGLARLVHNQTAGTTQLLNNSKN